MERPQEFEQPREIKRPNKLVELSQKWIERAGFNLSVQGVEHIREIPSEKRVIIASSHLSDHDTPITVAALGDYYPNLKVVDESTHYHLNQNPVMFGARKIAGEENFLKVDMDGGDSQRRGLFKNETFHK